MNSFFAVDLAIPLALGGVAFLLRAAVQIIEIIERRRPTTTQHPR
jgi:hypothetical protein